MSKQPRASGYFRTSYTEDFSLLGIPDDRGCCTVTFRIFDNLGLTPLHYGYAGVGRPKVYSNNLTHSLSPVCWRGPCPLLSLTLFCILALFD